MNRRYNKCHFCGGTVAEQRVVVDYRWGAELLAIIEDVPAGVCETCGERYFKAAVVKCDGAHCAVSGEGTKDD